MALTTTTAALSYTQAAFLRKEPTTKGDAMIFYFLGPYYIAEINKRISPQESLENLSEIDLRSHRGTHKFTIKNQVLQDSRYDSIRNLSGFELGVLEFGFSPRTFVDAKTNKQVSFTGLDFVSFKLGRNNNGAAASSSTASSSTASSSTASSSTVPISGKS